MRLDTEPTSDVEVHLSLPNAEMAVNATALTFSSADWDEWQTILVSATEDSEDEVMLVHDDQPGARYVGEWAHDGIAVDALKVWLALVGWARDDRSSLEARFRKLWRMGAAVPSGRQIAALRAEGYPLVQLRAQ